MILIVLNVSVQNKRTDRQIEIYMVKIFREVGIPHISSFFAEIGRYRALPRKVQVFAWLVAYRKVNTCYMRPNALFFFSVVLNFVELVEKVQIT